LLEESEINEIYRGLIGRVASPEEIRFARQNEETLFSLIARVKTTRDFLIINLPLLTKQLMFPYKNSLFCSLFKGANVSQRYFFHQQFLSQTLSDNSYRTLFEGDDVLFEHIVEDRKYEVRLTCSPGNIAEGLVQLSFRMNPSIMLYALSFLFIDRQSLMNYDGLTILVTRIQGSKGKLTQINQASVDMANLHPRNVLLACAEGITEAYNLQCICAVTSGLNPSFRGDNLNHIKNNYDEFFETLKKDASSSSIVVLPLPLIDEPKENAQSRNATRSNQRRAFHRAVTASAKIKWLSFLKQGWENAVKIVNDQSHPPETTLDLQTSMTKDQLVPTAQFTKSNAALPESIRVEIDLEKLDGFKLDTSKNL
jgi:uncharacterized protein VirK/YbjX